MKQLQLTWKTSKLDRSSEFCRMNWFPLIWSFWSRARRTVFVTWKRPQSTGKPILKLRQALTATETIDHFDGIAISCAAPNNEIYNFQGSIALPNSVNLPLDKNQFLPRGTILVNTGGGFSVSSFTPGRKRKMQNVKETGRRNSPKWTGWMTFKMHKLWQFYSFSLQFYSSVTFITIGQSFRLTGTWGSGNQTTNSNSFGQVIFANFVTFFLLLNNLVPISLSVTLEIVRSFSPVSSTMIWTCTTRSSTFRPRRKAQMFWMSWGRIEYIMTDKTGTLTCNQMNLKSLMIKGQVYNDFNSLLKALEMESPASRSIQQFLEFLVCCHTVMIDKRNGSFQASSPDEMACLWVPKNSEFLFISRTSEHVELKMFDGTVKSFEIKAIIEFTSDRKRMSVVIYDKSAQKYFRSH